MNHPALIAVLLGAAVLVIYFSCLGMALMRGAAARLHYLGPAALLAPVLVCVAVLVEEGFSQAGRKAIFIALLMVLEAPILAHIIGRVIYLRSIRQQNTPEPDSRKT